MKHVLLFAVIMGLVVAIIFRFFTRPVGGTGDRRSRSIGGSAYGVTARASSDNIDVQISMHSPSN